jgi:SAM-dependent methyltransferase
MAFTLSEVVPWGRAFDEYVAMFQLTDDDLGRSLLGCGDGPAAFNAELTRRGGRVVSVDPIDAFSAAEIRQRIAATRDTVLAQMRQNVEDYVWTSIRSVDELGRVRMAAMENFLSDYEIGRAQGRYIPGELPGMPLGDRSFDMALSSHFLFLYSAQLSADFHIRALMEMLRVAREVRVFPLRALDGTPTPHLDAVTERLETSGYAAEIRRVDYEFQRGANEMLRIEPI